MEMCVKCFNHGFPAYQYEGNNVFKICPHCDNRSLYATYTYSTANTMPCEVYKIRRKDNPVSLLKQLQDAVECENYELACIIRDKINSTNH
jgi:hypothetical protein